MLCLETITPFQITIIAIVITFVISNNRDAGDLNVIGNLLVASGSLILLIAAQKEFLKNKEENDATKEELMSQITSLKLQFERFKAK